MTYMPLCAVAIAEQVEVHPLPTGGVPFDEPPIEFIQEVGGLYFRAILLEKTGSVVPQHKHPFNHVTLVASGKVRMWVDGAWVGDFSGFYAIEIEANKEHVFQALEDNTRLSCVHDTKSAEFIKQMEA
jgi:quercetin dioxygenase-like cupin family protein